MRKKSNNIRRDLYASWPRGWQAEADRLAKLYTRTAIGIAEYDCETKKRKRVAVEMRKLRAHGDRFAHGLRGLVGDEDAYPDSLVSMYSARVQRLQASGDWQVDLEFSTYRNEIERFMATCAEIGADLERATELLRAGNPPDKGNQSQLALRFTIGAAASAYTKLFGKLPGQSRSDYGRLGKFVLEIIARVPIAHRPTRPSASAISDAVLEWRRRRVVAPRSG